MIDERKIAKIRREQKRRLWRWRMEDEELDKETPGQGSQKEL